MSDGSLRFICLTTLLLQPEPPSIILIDEPELGLHPHANYLLAEMLQAASVNSQIIVSTQSTSLLDQFTSEDVVVVEQGEHGSTFERLSNEKLKAWLGEYSLGDLWAKNIIGGTPL